MAEFEYISKGLSGYIVYKENDINFKLYYEFGGGNCIVSIYLPQDWEKETLTKQTEKARILKFISEKVIQDKAPNSYAEIIDDKWLIIVMA